MDKLYCIIYKWEDDSDERYIAARRSMRESSYAHGTNMVSEAAVHEDKKKMERKLAALKKEFPDELADAFVRPFTEKERKEYDKRSLEHKQYRDRESRKANWSLSLSEDGEVITFWTKKNLNQADRAGLELFQALGITMHKSEYGLTFFRVKRPDMSKKRGG